MFSSRAQLEAYSRQSARGTFMGDNKVLCHVLGKYKMYADSRDISITPHLMIDGHWEAWITTFLYSVIKSNWTVVDGGANVGYYTLLMADLVGPGGKVIAFEPNLIAATLLRQNVACNGLVERCELHNNGLGDGEIEEMYLNYYEGHDNFGSVRLLPRPVGDNQRAPMATLDSIVGDRHVDLIKLDIEGAEPAALRGAANTIDPDTHLLIEYASWTHENPAQFIDQLLSLGRPLRYVNDWGELSPTTEVELLLHPMTLRMLWLANSI